jgi:hypothetical protein
MKKELKVNEVEIVNGTPVVRGQFGDTAFEAAPFRWGSKMLMKVTGGDFDRGTRIAIGHAAKKALKANGIPLPKAELKRPPKAKPVAEVPKEDFTGKTVKELRQLCKDRGITGHSRDGVTRADLVVLLGG